MAVLETRYVVSSPERCYVIYLITQKFTREKTRRMVPMPAVTPLQIPFSPSQEATPVPRSGGIRRSALTLSGQSLGWNSDIETDSSISGVSTARDVFSKSFSFSTRPSNVETPVRELNQRMVRQDSATLPRDVNWDGAAQPMEVVSRSSSRSMKRRKRDAAAAGVLPPPDAFVVPAREPRVEQSQRDVEVEDLPAPPPRKDSVPRANVRTLHASPPSVTPSALKLSRTEQAALHRVSRIAETNAEASIVSAIPPSGQYEGLKISDARHASPQVVSSALSSPSVYSKHSASRSSSPARSQRYASTSVHPSKMDYESFLDDFQVISPVSFSRRGQEPGGHASSTVQVPATVASTANGSMSGSASGSGSVSGSSGSPHLPASSNSSHARRFGPYSATSHSETTTIGSPLASAGSRSDGYSPKTGSGRGSSRHEHGRANRSRNGSNASIGCNATSSSKNTSTQGTCFYLYFTCLTGKNR